MQKKGRHVSLRGAEDDATCFSPSNSIAYFLSKGFLNLCKLSGNEGHFKQPAPYPNSLLSHREASMQSKYPSDL